ncbi:MAG TPA: prolipoprotein diacylglyceryl transferase [Clostridiales bacterium]|nr:prolipoprotein diacylglyceryl transferase [Clostridiales bacterium]
MGIIQFPNLFGGLTLYVDRVAFTPFGVPIYWYGLFIAFGFMLSLIMAGYSARKFKIKKDDLYDLVLICAPIAIICARLFYVIFDWQTFKNDLGAIFNFRQGGLAIYGAVIGAFGAAYLVCKKKKMIPLRVFDFAAPYFAFSQAIGRWGNFVNQEAFGVNTNLPWGMTGNRIRSYLENQQGLLASQGMQVNPELPVHPTFLYESLWNMGAFFLLLWLRKNKKVDGEVFFGYMILYGLGRSWIEGLRTDSLMLGSFRISQLLAIAFVIVFGALFIYRRRKTPNLEQKEFYDPNFVFAVEETVKADDQQEHQSEYTDLVLEKRAEAKVNTGHEEEHTENKVEE